jgi:Zn-dependent peptidase ImmA (M78 family)
MAKVSPKKWTEKEDNFIKENYLKMDNKVLAEKFNVTFKSIEGKLRRMGLKRPKTATKENKEKKSREKKNKEKKNKEKEKKSREKKSRDRKPLLIHIHQNIRCRACFLVDGYTESEENCRYCGATLFKLDMI